MSRLRATAAGVALLALLALLAGCSGGPILANPAAARDRPPDATPSHSPAADPQQSSLPADDAPHHRPTDC